MWNQYLLPNNDSPQTITEKFKQWSVIRILIRNITISQDAYPILKQSHVENDKFTSFLTA